MNVEQCEALITKWERRERYCVADAARAQRDGLPDKARGFLEAAERARTHLASAKLKLQRAQVVLEGRLRRLARKATTPSIPGQATIEERGIGYVQVLHGDWQEDQLSVGMDWRGKVRYWYVYANRKVVIRPDKPPRKSKLGYGSGGWRSKFEAEMALQMVQRHEESWLNPEGRKAALRMRPAVGSLTCETLWLRDVRRAGEMEREEAKAKQEIAAKKMAEQARGVELRAQLTTVRAQNEAARVQRKQRDEAACEKALADAAHARELVLAKCKTPGEKQAVIKAYGRLNPDQQDAQQIVEQSARRIMLATNALEDHRRTERREGRAPLDIGILGTNRTSDPNPWE